MPTASTIMAPVVWISRRSRTVVGVPMCSSYNLWPKRGKTFSEWRTRLISLTRKRVTRSTMHSSMRTMSGSAHWLTRTTSIRTTWDWRVKCLTWGNSLCKTNLKASIYSQNLPTDLPGLPTINSCQPKIKKLSPKCIKRTIRSYRQFGLSTWKRKIRTTFWTIWRAIWEFLLANSPNPNPSHNNSSRPQLHPIILNKFLNIIRPSPNSNHNNSTTNLDNLSSFSIHRQISSKRTKRSMSSLKVTKMRPKSSIELTLTKKSQRPNWVTKTSWVSTSLADLPPPRKKINNTSWTQVNKSTKRTTWTRWKKKRKMITRRPTSRTSRSIRTRFCANTWSMAWFRSTMGPICTTWFRSGTFEFSASWKFTRRIKTKMTSWKILASCPKFWKNSKVVWRRHQTSCKRIRRMISLLTAKIMEQTPS